MPMAECDINYDIHCRHDGGVSTRTRNLKGDDTDRITTPPSRLTPITRNVEAEAPAKNLITGPGRHSG